MAATAVFKRVEKKYVMDTDAWKRAMPVIRKHMEEDRYCVGGKFYRICNLYFDTAGHDVIRQSLKKPFFKEKLRMRSYGFPESESTDVFLELKRKINGIVAKRRATLPYGMAFQFMKNREIPRDLSYIDRQVLREIREYLTHHDIASATLLTYERSAWFDKEDTGFRLTFDRSLRYRDGAAGMNPRQETLPLMPEDFILMEAKVEGAYPLWFARLLAREGIHPQSFSKYGVVYKTLLKNNRFSGDPSIDVLGRL